MDAMRALQAPELFRFMGQTAPGLGGPSKNEDYRS
jgi:hypothetical protein